MGAYLSLSFEEKKAIAYNYTDIKHRDKMVGEVGLNADRAWWETRVPEFIEVRCDGAIKGVIVVKRHPSAGWFEYHSPEHARDKKDGRVFIGWPLESRTNQGGAFIFGKNPKILDKDVARILCAEADDQPTDEDEQDKQDKQDRQEPAP